MCMKMPPVKADNSGRFLTAMLQRMQAKGRVDIGLIGAIDAKNGTFFMQMIIIKWVGCGAGHGLSLAVDGAGLLNINDKATLGVEMGPLAFRVAWSVGLFIIQQFKRLF